MGVIMLKRDEYPKVLYEQKSNYQYFDGNTWYQIGMTLMSNLVNVPEISSEDKPTIKEPGNYLVKNCGCLFYANTPVCSC